MTKVMLEVKRTINGCFSKEFLEALKIEELMDGIYTCEFNGERILLNEFLENFTVLLEGEEGGRIEVKEVSECNIVYDLIHECEVSRTPVSKELDDLSKELDAIIADL